MKRIMIACVAVAALAAPAFAGGATVETKAQGTNVDKATNAVGYYSSLYTGNGGVIGGNGSCDVSLCGAVTDQTTATANRGDAIQALQATQGRGSLK